jgi:nucleoside-diphosphate-sugar epimerase
MSLAFALYEKGESPPVPERKTVMITGAAGRIGRSLSAYAADRYDLRLLVRRADQAGAVDAHGEVHVGDCTDLAMLKQAFRSCDTVVHLAADPSPAALWESVLPNNIIAAYNVFVAALAAGCRRVVFASSIHAVSGYPDGYQVHPEEPVNPGDLYGVSKCFGEACGRYMAMQHGLSVIAIRIGGFKSIDSVKNRRSVGYMNAFVSRRDLDQLLCRCIDDRRLKFAIVHGLSDNPFNRMDIHTARELLGYRPQDDFTELNRTLADIAIRRQVRPHSDRESDQPPGIRGEAHPED